MVEPQRAKVLSLPFAHESRSNRPDRPLLLSDPSSQLLRQQIERIAASRASVLIIGETGTGKEIVARQIHEFSARTGPFIAVNCGAFNEGLAEAELFGHEAGAFTGAQRARAGWFEAADGGTLLLDEIGEMPAALQVKLLRVLQERCVVRLGARTPKAIDVRVVAATNVALEDAVASGRFRRDLYYRLNVAEISLLPLRERPGDILPLARHFIDIYRHPRDTGHIELTPAAVERLQNHDWPGNIRELENVLHFAVITCRGGVVDAADLRLTRSQLAGTAAPVLQRGRARDHDELSVVREGLQQLLSSNQEDIFESVTRLLLTTAFAHCQGNQVRTAKRLGVSRNVLRAQLKRHGLLQQPFVQGARAVDAAALP
jgi:sigma-54-specific transcriptional regulator